MKRFSQQFKKQSESISLRASEKRELLARINTYMEYHPLAEQTAPRRAHTQTGIASEPFTMIRISPLFLRGLVSAFVVVFVVGIPFFAENTVPGDILYPVKVQFNEELRSSLALSPYDKVAWETERLERRIAEARLLASEGKLTDEAQQQVAEAVKTHTDAAQREIAELRESDTDEAAIAEITLESALAVQTEVLESHQEGVATSGTTSEGHSVDAIAQVVADAREDAASQSTTPSYDKLLGKVEEESTRVYELFESVKKNASPEEVSDIEKRLNGLEDKVSQAVAMRTAPAPQATMLAKSAAPAEPSSGAATMSLMMVASDTPVATDTATSTDLPSDAPAPAIDPETERESVHMLRSALGDIQKLLNYMTHIDVRESVSIDDLVPLIQTPEEERAEIERNISETQALREEAATHQIGEALAEKVSVGDTGIAVKLALATSSLEAGDLEASRAAANDAYNLALDLHLLVQDEPLKESGLSTPDGEATATASSTPKAE
jgi:hypothetical protein